MVQTKKGLGKGLGALISPSEPNNDNSSEKSGVIEVDINKIEPNKQQPRKYFDEASLTELAESLKEFGVIQPIIVKQEDGYYSIVAGERRWRAARLAKIEKLPVIIKDYNDLEILQIALIENIQRQDLNPIEEALCYKRLVDEFFFSQEDIATKVGKSRNTISYSVGLLNLDPRVQNFLIEGKLTPGHARHLLLIKDGDLQFQLSDNIIEEGLSVRETEKVVKTSVEENNNIEKQTETKQKYFDKALLQVEKDLKQILGTKVSIKNGMNRGKIEIEYYSPDELDRILGIFKKIES